MYILTLRTDKPISEIGIFNDRTKLDYLPYKADRQLAETIHQQIETLLHKQNLDFKDVGGLVVYKGPGSFTGLRIGITVANALAYSLKIPIVGAVGDKNWLELGIDSLISGKNDESVVPEYGAAPNITSPRK